MRKKNSAPLLIALALTANACIVVVEDEHGRDSSFGSTYEYGYSMWFNDANVYCEYDAVDNWSRWTFVASPDTSWGEDEIDEVYVDILGAYAYTYTNWFQLTPRGHGEWAVSFDNYGGAGNSYYCGSSYDFQFTAYDYDDYYTITWVYW